MIYLDYSANYPTKNEVLEELVNVEKKYIGNFNSLHTMGVEAKELVKGYEKKIASLLGFSLAEFDIIFTSSATEANNLAIKGVAKSYSGFGKKILVSELEHNSVNGALGYLKEEGFDVEFINTLSNGKIDLDDLKAKMSNNVILVSAILLDSELGTLEPYKEIYDIIKDYPHCHLLTDATQAIAKYEINFNYINMLSFTPHKFGGITGSGVLIKRKKTILTPLIHGGESQSIYRAGSVPLGIIASITKSIELTINSREENVHYLEELGSYFINELKKIKKITINSFENLFIFNISVNNYKGAMLVDLLNEKGICVSYKSACSIKNTPSKIVFAVYKDKKRASECIRISISEKTTKEELDYLLEVLRSL